MPERTLTPGGPPAKGWVELRSTRSVRKAFQLLLLVGIVWEFFTLAIGLTALTRPGRHSAAGILAFVACLLIGLIPLGYAAYAYLIRRNFDDARVFVNRKELVLGDNFQVRVEQRALRQVKVNEMRVALVCEETVRFAGADGQSRTRNVPLVQKFELLTRDKETAGVKQMTATRRFEVPADQPASSEVGKSDLPIVTWKVRVITTPAQGPQYEADFPIRVHATSSAGMWGEMSGG